MCQRLMVNFCRVLLPQHSWYFQHVPAIRIDIVVRFCYVRASQELHQVHRLLWDTQPFTCQPNAVTGIIYANVNIYNYVYVCSHIFTTHILQHIQKQLHTVEVCIYNSLNFSILSSMKIHVVCLTHTLNHTHTHTPSSVIFSQLQRLYKLTYQK